MDSYELIQASNEKIRDLMDARDEIMSGNPIYFEVGSQSGTLPFSDELIEAFDLMIELKSQKHREFVEVIEKAHKLAGELDLDTY